MTEIEEGFAANIGQPEKVGGRHNMESIRKVFFLAKMESADYIGPVSYGCNGGSAAQMGQRRRADPTL